jgi:mutator protein MutT
MNRKPHFHVTAGLIWHDGRILIARRPKGSHLEGYWEFPGGKQEKNESLSSCLEREIQEELRISVKVEDYLLTVDHEYETKSISLHLFQCAWLSGTPTPIGCDEIRWVRPGELTEYQFPPPDIRILEFIRNRASLSQTREGYDTQPG